MTWIRTSTGKLVNLAHHSEVSVMSLPRDRDDPAERFAIVAYEPTYSTDTPCMVTLCEYTRKADAAEALQDLYDWLADGQSVRCDYFNTGRKR